MLAKLLTFWDKGKREGLATDAQRLDKRCSEVLELMLNLGGKVC